MQAIILAAGLSKRLRPLTDSKPKCLLEIGGRCLLEMTIENITKYGISDFVIVTGYRENMIRDFINGKYPELNVTFLNNTDYENNNNSYSLWMTKDYIYNDCLLLDSDILFDHRIIGRLIYSGYENCLAVKIHKLGEEEVKVMADENNKILKIGKDLNPETSLGESIGIEKISLNFMKDIFRVLDRKIIQENNLNEFYETTFQEVYEQGNEMFAVDVSDYKCIEIDYPEDLKLAEVEIKSIESP